MKSLLLNIKYSAVVLALLIAGKGYANPGVTNQTEEVAVDEQAVAIALAKQSPDHILLVKDENGKWTLFNSNQLFFPENEIDGFKIIKLPGKLGDASKDNALSINGAGSSNSVDGGSDGSSGSPGAFSASNVVARMLGKAAPYLTTVARVAAGAGLIALGVKFGGLALSAGMIAGLSVLGMPVTTAIAVAGVITMSTGSQSSMLGGLAQSLVSKIPFLGSWFRSSTDQMLDVLDTLVVPNGVPSSALSGAAKCAVALTC